MSTINKKPYIKSLFESMSDTDLNTLSTLMDGGGNQTAIRKTMNVPSGDKTKIDSDDKGVHLCSLEINYSVFMGYLIYNDDYCCLIWFTDSQVLKCFDIDVSKNEIKTINEELNILELRSALYEAKGGSGGGSGGDDPKIYEVDDIEDIPAEILEELQPGDVIKYILQGLEVRCAVVTFKAVGGHYLSIVEDNGISALICSYQKDDNTWTCFVDEPSYSLIEFADDITDLDQDFFAKIDSSVTVWEGEDDTGKIWHPIYQYNDGDLEGLYFQTIGIDSITLVRYVEDDDTHDMVFDDTYGTSGYNTISLGGGSGSSSLYLHSIFISYNDGEGKSFDLYLSLTNTSSTAFTKSSLKSYIQTFSSVWSLSASGYAYSDRAEGPIQRITNASTSGLITVDGFMYDNGSLHVSSFMTLIDITDASVFQDVVSAL